LQPVAFCNHNKDKIKNLKKMKNTIVRYRLKPARVQENEKLVRAVYEQLHERKPAGFRYVTYKLEDGVTFIHVAISEADGKSPLSDLPAFKSFQADINDRCEELPVGNHAGEIGSYRIRN